MNIEMLYKILSAGHVRRCHTVDVLHQQNLAEHQWGVALIAYYLAEALEGGDQEALLFAALTHDCPEVATGDIPSQVKRDPAVAPVMSKLENAWWGPFSRPDLSGPQRQIVKMADHLELLRFCDREFNRGNATASLLDMWERATKYAEEYLAKCHEDIAAPARPLIGQWGWESFNGRRLYEDATNCLVGRG